MKEKVKIQMSRIEFVMFMLGFTHRHMAALEATTKMDKSQMKGGKVTASKYGGFVIKNAKITWNHGVDYLKAVKAKLEKFGLDPEAFLASEHKFVRRALKDGKLTTMGYHKEDEELPISARRWYLITYVMNGVVKSSYDYTDANGNPVDKQSFHADLYPVTSKKQADAGLDTIDKQVLYRNYGINSINKVMFDGYEITLV